MHACTRPKIEHVIRRPNRIFIMLHHKHSISKITQSFQRLKQSIIVALMQSDTGFI